MSEAVNNLRIGDSVVSRVTGNPYCKDRATGEVVKVNGSFVRIRLQDGLEIAVKREWITARKEKDARKVTESQGEGFGSAFADDRFGGGSKHSGGRDGVARGLQGQSQGHLRTGRRRCTAAVERDAPVQGDQSGQVNKNGDQVELAAN